MYLVYLKLIEFYPRDIYPVSHIPLALSKKEIINKRTLNGLDNICPPPPQFPFASAVL